MMLAIGEYTQGTLLNPAICRTLPSPIASSIRSVSVIKYSDQKQLMGGNGLFLVTASSHSLLLRKVEGRPGCYCTQHQPKKSGRSRAGYCLLARRQVLVELSFHTAQENSLPTVV